jgi:hypothetical protein
MTDLPRIPRIAPALALVAAAAFFTSASAQPGGRLPMRNLLVEVRQGEESRFTGQAAAVQDAGVVIGSDGSVLGRVNAGAATRSSAGNEDYVQKLNVLNGGQASLRVGGMVPMQWWEIVWSPSGPGIVGGTQYLDTGRGVLVMPRWPGGDAPVVVEIRAQSSRLASPRYTPDGQPVPEGGVERSELVTTVQMPLNTWVTVASAGESNVARDRETLSTRSTDRARRQVLQMRVSAP